MDSNTVTETLVLGGWDTKIHQLTLSAFNEISSHETTDEASLPRWRASRTDTDETWSLQFHTSTLVASSGRDMLILWELSEDTNYQLEKRSCIPNAHNHTIRSMWYPRESALLYSGDTRGSIKAWDMSTHQPIFAAQHDTQQTRNLRTSAQILSNSLFAWARDSISVFDVRANQTSPQLVISHYVDGNVLALFSGDLCQGNGQSLVGATASVKSEHIVSVWDLRHLSEPLCILGSHSDVISIMQFVDSDTLITGSNDSSVGVWSVSAMSRLGTLTPPKKAWIKQLQYDANRGRLMVAHGGATPIYGLTVYDFAPHKR